MEEKDKILNWLKEELNLTRIQVVIPPTDKEIKKAIKDLIKIPEMKDMFKKILGIERKEYMKKEYMKKLAFMLKCNNCKVVSTHRFIEFEDSDNRLKCLNCGYIGYILHKEDFDNLYIGNIRLTELNFREIK